jgi:hypothetical protein
VWDHRLRQPVIPRKEWSVKIHLDFLRISVKTS